jgi:hypothetical protein
MQLLVEETVGKSAGAVIDFLRLVLVFQARVCEIQPCIYWNAIKRRKSTDFLGMLPAFNYWETYSPLKLCCDA